MICRSKERAEKARNEIVEMTSNPNVKILLADVGELDQVRSAVKKLQASESEIYCLVCNAGILSNEKQISSEGHEATIASHLFGGSYLLSQLLLPQLKAAADKLQEPRVIFVTSGGMCLERFPCWEQATNTEKGQVYDGVVAYSRAKRGQVLLAEQLSKAEPNITWLSAHPGWVNTGIVSDAFGDSKKYLEPMRNAWEGAEGLTWLMGAEKSMLKNGEFYLDREIQEKHMIQSLTKNSDSEIDEMMSKLQEVCNL